MLRAVGAAHSRRSDVDADQVEMGRCVEQMPIVGIDAIHTVCSGTGALNCISGTELDRRWIADRHSPDGSYRLSRVIQI